MRKNVIFCRFDSTSEQFIVIIKICVEWQQRYLEIIISCTCCGVIGKPNSFCILFVFFLVNVQNIIINNDIKYVLAIIVFGMSTIVADGAKCLNSKDSERYVVVNCAYQEFLFVPNTDVLKDVEVC